MSIQPSVLELQHRPATADDTDAIAALLDAVDLPRFGLEDHIQRFRVTTAGDAVVACAGIEVYGREALLRSVAVSPACRGQGLAKPLVEAVLADAKSAGVRAVYLLTATARDYFLRLGFYVIDRSLAPASIQAVPQFADHCSSAALMIRPL